MKRIAQCLAIATVGSVVLLATQAIATETEVVTPVQPAETPRKVDAAELNTLLTESANRIQPHLNSDQRQAVAALKKSLDVR